MTSRLDDDRVVLLFFRDWERDRFVPYDRYLQRMVKSVRRRVSRNQRTSGFYVWCQLLVKALTVAGYDVRMNDRRTARRNPTYPVGIVGYPDILEGWDLPNPAVLGPALYDHPAQRPTLMADPRFRTYVVTCAWMRDMFAPVYGDACVEWHAGIDLDEWTDSAGRIKDIDVLVYDKVRWDRSRYEPELIRPIMDHVQGRGLRVETVRYGDYQPGDYRDLLQRSRSMIFLCEHETQGMAYQEAMASNVPLLCWDNGLWLDPRREQYSPAPVRASSVPHFDPTCGERFAEIDSFAATFDGFWSRLDSYAPREFVRQHLSLTDSARIYMRHYDELKDR